MQIITYLDRDTINIKGLIWRDTYLLSKVAETSRQWERVGLFPTATTKELNRATLIGKKHQPIKIA